MIPEKFTTLVYWIREREKIRIAKEAGQPRPWTTDPILHEWRFCNVNRCDDTVTRWIFENIIAKHKDSSTLWFNLVIARLVNWPDTLVKLGYYDQWDADHFVDVLKMIEGKAWTGAYMIPAGPPGVDKARYLADETLGSLWDRRAFVPTDGTCARWHAFIEGARSMGGFLANQVVTDLKYTRVLQSAPDWDSHIVAGPGTQRGLNRLLGHDLKRPWNIGRAALVLAVVRIAVLKEVPELAEMFRDLNNLSNCMCEFDKYERVLLKEGKPRSRYVMAMPPAGWVKHPTAPGWFHNRKEVLNEAQLRARFNG